jgi:outer membrane protein assembly factor BamB
MSLVDHSVQLDTYAKSLVGVLTCLAKSVAAPTPAAAAVSASPRSTPSFNGTVYAVAYRGDTVYVGGSFTVASSNGRAFAREKVAAFSASTGALLPWAPSVKGTVKALAVSGDAVYLAGDFYWIGGGHRDGLARLDATTGALTGFDHSVRGEAAALTIGGGRLYVGGRFSAVDSMPRGNLAAFSLATGALDRGWRAAADNRVEAVLAVGNRVYVAGNFRRVNRAGGTPRLAAVNAASGELDPRFRPQAPAVIFGLAADPSGVYAATGGPGGRATAYTSGGAVRWTHLFNGDLHAIVVVGGIAYVGGHFDTACRRPSTIRQLGCLGGKISRVKLAALDSRGGLAPWNPHANGIVGVRALASNGRQVAAGGAFTAVGGIRHEYYAAFG